MVEKDEAIPVGNRQAIVVEMRAINKATGNYVALLRNLVHANAADIPSQKQLKDISIRVAQNLNHMFHLFATGMRGDADKATAEAKANYGELDNKQKIFGKIALGISNFGTFAVNRVESNAEKTYVRKFIDRYDQLKPGQRTERILKMIKDSEKMENLISSLSNLLRE